MRLAQHPRPTIHTPQILHLGSPASHHALPRTIARHSSVPVCPDYAPRRCARPRSTLPYATAPLLPGRPHVPVLLPLFHRHALRQQFKSMGSPWCYAVAVVGCRVHGRRRYTLYAAGHYPYGRVAVVPYSAGGELLWEADRGGPPWQATLFGAAQDAARGQMWPSEQNWWQRRDARRRRTQGRRLEMGGRLTGVGGGLEEREREQIATRLGVATMTVLSGARRWGRSWQSRGAAIVAVLGALACSATLGDRMGAAGAVSDLWGPPRPRLVARWEQAGKSWLVAASGGSEAREQGAAGSHRGRAPPATKAPVGAVSGGATVGS